MVKGKIGLLLGKIDHFIDRGHYTFAV